MGRMLQPNFTRHVIQSPSRETEGNVVAFQTSVRTKQEDLKILLHEDFLTL